MLKIIQESLDDVKTATFWRACAAELLGTMMLVFFGCGSALPQQSQTGMYTEIHFLNLNIGIPGP